LKQVVVAVVAAAEQLAAAVLDIGEQPEPPVGLQAAIAAAADLLAGIVVEFAAAALVVDIQQVRRIKSYLAVVAKQLSSSQVSCRLECAPLPLKQQEQQISLSCQFLLSMDL
jgi:hypothetical protein